MFKIFDFVSMAVWPSKGSFFVAKLKRQQPSDQVSALAVKIDVSSLLKSSVLEKFYSSLMISGDV